MSSSKLLEQAIVDAQALRDSAYKNAQAALVEKFAPQIKEAVEKLLEQEEDPAAMAGSPEDALAADIPAGTDFGGAPPDTSDKGFVAGAAKDVPLAATDGEKLCPCPDDEEEVTLQLDLSKLADELQIGKEAEEDNLNQQPMLGGMMDQPPAVGGAALAENLEFEGIELEEAEELTEVDLDEVLSEVDEPEADEEEDDKNYRSASGQELDRMTGKSKAERNPLVDDDTFLEEEVLELEESEEELKNPKKADLNKEGKLSSYEKKRGKAIEKSMGLKETKQLLQASQALLKEVENKDVKIQKLLEENKKFSSTIEEMSLALKKLEEVNTLNAKLFYQNQILKSASLNERQKTHIVEAVSKADSVSEAKAVYETLVNSVGGPAEKERSPKSLNEAINKTSSFRLPHKQAEQPHDPNKDRWLKLAGIK
jgi:hypothetical protein